MREASCCPDLMFQMHVILWLLAPPTPQVPAQLFVFGDGDCGQLGLGEDVTERLRPFPVDVDGKKVEQRF